MVTIAEISRKLNFSRGRFYQLVNDGIFPLPLRTDDNRPYYSTELEEKCKNILESGVGLNGKIVLFNVRKNRGDPSYCNYCGKEHFFKNRKYCCSSCRVESAKMRIRKSHSISLDDLLENGLERPNDIIIECRQCKKESSHKYTYRSTDKKWYLSYPCTECINRQSRERYKKNPEKYHTKYINGRRSKKSQLRNLAIAYLGGKCSICGIKEPLDFHHIDPAQKSFLVSQYFNTCVYGKKPPNLLDHPILLKELDKCELLCANHHRNKHNE